MLNRTNAIEPLLSRDMADARGTRNVGTSGADALVALGKVGLAIVSRYRRHTVNRC